MEMLGASGYGLEWREKVLLGTMKGYARIIFTCSQEELPRSRPGWRLKVGRRYKRFLGSAEWFKKKREEENFSTGVVQEPRGVKKRCPFLTKL